MKNIVCLIVLSIVSYLPLKAQKLNDKLLQTFFSNVKSDKSDFTLLTTACDTIHIVDTSNYFSRGLKIDFEKVVVVEMMYIKRPPLKEWNCNIIISLKELKRNRYLLTYLHEPSNSVGIIQYKLSKGKFKRVKSQYGQL